MIKPINPLKEAIHNRTTYKGIFLFNDKEELELFIKSILQKVNAEKDWPPEDDIKRVSITDLDNHYQTAILEQIDYYHFYGCGNNYKYMVIVETYSHKGTFRIKINLYPIKTEEE